MHVFCLIAFLTALLASTPASLETIQSGEFTPPKALDHFRVVDWNIDRGTTLDRIAAALEREHPDLCLLQEVDLFARRSGSRNVAEELARRLKLNYVFVPEWGELGQGNGEQSAYQGQAILTRLPIKNVRFIRFQTQSDFWRPRSYVPNWSLLQRRTGGRVAQVIELALPHGTMVVYNTHLESRSAGRIQSRQLEEILADTHTTPIILAGDLNTKYNAKSFAVRLREAGWHNMFGDRVPRTHWLVGRLDWILVRGPLQVDDARVLPAEGASDHFPIAGTVSVSKLQRAER